ncbi:MAG: hypothetical protein ACK4WD_02905 [Flavobacteriales bacterium]|jgi:hypothetical protein
MRPFEKYDPEDIESLLITKQFAELYPEEKEFVLRHISDEEQYNSMRKMLIEIREISKSDDLLMPDASIKKNLMAEFNREKKGRFSVWLNSLFAAPEVPWFRQSGVQMAFGIGVVLIGVWGIMKWNNANSPVALAEVRKEENTTDAKTASADSILTNENDELAISVDTSSKNVLPQKPQVLSMNAPVQEESVREESAQEAPIAVADAAEMDADATTDDSMTPKAESTSAGSSFSNVENLSSVSIESKKTITSKSRGSLDATLTAPSLQDYNEIIDVLFTAR